MSEETINMKEGCLSFPFLFLMINRPKWVNVQYTDENGETVEEYLHGMSARIFQHENEHMNGYIFTDLVSKMKLDRAKKAQAKLIKQTISCTTTKIMKTMIINRDIIESIIDVEFFLFTIISRD